MTNLKSLSISFVPLHTWCFDGEEYEMLYDEFENNNFDHFISPQTLAYFTNLENLELEGDIDIMESQISFSSLKCLVGLKRIKLGSFLHNRWSCFPESIFGEKLELLSHLKEIQEVTIDDCPMKFDFQAVQEKYPHVLFRSLVRQNVEIPASLRPPPIRHRNRVLSTWNFIFVNGYYTGNFIYDPVKRKNLRHGHGMIQYVKGQSQITSARFEGEFQKNKQVKGFLVIPNGQIHQGEWDKNLVHVFLSDRM